MRQVPRWDGKPDDGKSFRRVTLKRRQFHQLTGLIQASPLVLCEGTAKVQSRASGDIQQVLSAGDIIGLSELMSGRNMHEVEVRPLSDEVVVCDLPPLSDEDFWSHMTTEQRKHTMKQLSDHAMFGQRLLARMRLPLTERFVMLLSDLDRKFGTPYGQLRMIDVPLTKIDLATFLGSTQESVVRVFSEFRKQGLVSSNGKKVIILQKSVFDQLRQSIEVKFQTEG
jgi:CRP/FNR family transcriptional regulator